MLFLQVGQSVVQQDREELPVPGVIQHAVLCVFPVEYPLRSARIMVSLVCVPGTLNRNQYAVGAWEVFTKEGILPGRSRLPRPHPERRLRVNRTFRVSFEH